MAERRKRLSYYDVLERWVQEMGKDNPAPPPGYAEGVNVDPDEPRRVMYRSTELGRYVVPAERGQSPFWLLNGDSYYHGGRMGDNTGAHQDSLRRLVEQAGLRVLILPYSVLGSAGIDRDTIIPIDIRPDHMENIPHSAATLDEVPGLYRLRWIEPHHDENGTYIPWHQVPITPADDGRYHWTTQRHWLGASVFRAQVSYDQRVTHDDGTRETVEVSGVRWFLSDFDENEPGPLYFLCELPAGARHLTIADALNSLKPWQVTSAEDRGIPVYRQGDVFAIQRTGLTQKGLAEQGYVRPAPSPVGIGKHEAVVLGVNHTATEVMVHPVSGVTYARGILRHRPAHRRPEHRNVKLGDGKTWFRLLKNTVPEGRSWSLGGRVD